MLPEFEFTLPACGKTLTWRPLPIGDSLDTTAANSSSPVKLGSELIIRRVIRYDGKEGPPKPIEWRAWEEADYEALADEISEKESARKAMFRKARAGENLGAQLEAAIAEAQVALADVGRKLQAIVEMHQVAMAARDPLGSGNS